MPALTEQHPVPISRAANLSENGLLVGVIVIVTTGCTVEPAHIRTSSLAPESRWIREEMATFKGVTADGEVRYGNQTERLAGIKMRSAAETREPGGVELVNRMVRAVSADVRVEHVRKVHDVVVYFKQPIYYRDRYLPTYPLMPRNGWACLNEMLVYMGLADYASEPAPSMKSSISTACAKARLEYARAACRCSNFVTYDEVTREPRLIYTWDGEKQEPEFRVCLARGDQKQCGSERWRAIFASTGNAGVQDERTTSELNR